MYSAAKWKLWFNYGKYRNAILEFGTIETVLDFLVLEGRFVAKEIKDIRQRRILKSFVALKMKFATIK